LRRSDAGSAATKAFIGFGNPLLEGDQAHPVLGAHYKMMAARAHERHQCPARRSPVAWAAGRPVKGATQPVLRAGMVDPAQLKAQSPLPETADELCAVASIVGAVVGAVHLGANSTEASVKALSASGALASYRIVHFATHGAVAGQIAGATEPGLILTPPPTASAEDDGFLSASEVAGLRLDADWVILSACNTAAGGAKDAEALSGLARAFFYAGARSLLVSHWAVDSQATVKLVANAVGATLRDPNLSQAGALQRAMLSLIDRGRPHEAHPAYWASFVVVGEARRGVAPAATAMAQPTPLPNQDRRRLGKIKVKAAPAKDRPAQPVSTPPTNSASAAR
jgi:hypothetical protein